MNPDSAAVDDRPNVVLICADQWRGDCLGSAGHAMVNTPYLDQLAGRGVRFDRAYSATPTCIPARAALMTGMSQQGHGRVGYEEGRPWRYPVTLAGEFRRHGYHTQAIGKQHVWPERARLGFDDVLLHDGYVHHSRDGLRDPAAYDDFLPWLKREAGSDADYADDGIDCNSVVARPWDKPESWHPTNWVAAEGVRWLHRRDPTVPFFLYLSFHRPHPPYDPPRWAFEQYLGLEPHVPPVGDWAHMYDAWRDDSRADAHVARYPQRVLDRARAGYYGAMTHIDQQINRFLIGLDEHGLGRNTYIMFTSDHGEMLGDHGMFRKGYPYEGSARVPLILAGPPGSRLPAGTSSTAVVELRDIMPTLLECAGLPIPPTVEGVSLLPHVGGEAAGTPAVREYLHGEHTLAGQSLQWIVTHRWKYVWLSGTGHEQLFDLGADPRELHDLAAAPDHAADLERLRGHLVAELTGREEDYVADGALVPGRAPINTLTRTAGDRAGSAASRRSGPLTD
ncbi:arylsulfatase [Actinomadura nitritigenes]